MLDRAAVEALAELRDTLDSAGYTEAAIEELLGVSPNELDEDDLQVHLRRLPETGALPGLIRLFLLGQAVSTEDVRLPVAALERIGVLERVEERIVPLVYLTPWGGLLLAHDGVYSRESGATYVMGVGPSTASLAQMTVRRPVGSALDLGAGCGVLALLAARHAEHVVAADLNPRALQLTALNAVLNGIENVECLEGDLFEPVQGREFDLVLANPPYAISPDSGHLSRDGDVSGDEICREIVTSAPTFLCAGGFAQILCNWICRAGDEGAQPVRRWLDGSGCDAWILHHRTEDPLSYATLWNEDMKDSSPATYSLTLQRWLDYYEREGIVGIGTGAVILRKRSGTNWVLETGVTFVPTGEAGEQILRVFQAQDDLARLDGEALLDSAFALVEPHRLEQTLVYRDGEYWIEQASFLLEDGVGLLDLGSTETDAFQVIVRLDGRRNLGQLVSDVARQTGLEEATLRAQTAEAVERLYGLGFLERVG